MHLKINDKLSENFFKLIDMSVLNLDKIYFEENLIIYSNPLMEKLSNANISIIDLSSKNAIIPTEGKYIKLKINETGSEYFLKESDIKKDYIKINF